MRVITEYEVGFEGLRAADLIVDATYPGGKSGGAGDDPISKLLGCGNQGGFRLVGKTRVGSYRLAVLYSSGEDPDWPDFLDVETGQFVYYGDNKRPGSDLHDKKGNRLLRDVFNGIHSVPPFRGHIPPFFLFQKGPQGRDVVFKGLAIPGGHEIQKGDQLVAIWKTAGGQRFQNYRAVFTVLDENRISRQWIKDLHNGQSLSNECPHSWREWVENATYRPLRSERSIEHRTPQEQLPSTPIEKMVVEEVFTYFENDRFGFEKCAAEIRERE